MKFISILPSSMTNTSITLEEIIPPFLFLEHQMIPRSGGEEQMIETQEGLSETQKAKGCQVLFQACSNHLEVHLLLDAEHLRLLHLSGLQ